MLMEYQKKKDYLYNIKGPYGTLHTDIILLGRILYAIKKGFSPIILVVGSQRIGKSFVAVWIGFRIMRFFHRERQFDIKRNTFYDPLQAIQRLEDLNMEPVIIDEAGAMLNKSEWYQKISIALDKIIQTMGFLSNTYIFVSPFGADVAKSFRKHFDYIVYVRRRGAIVVKEVPKKYDDLSGKMPKPFRIEQIRLHMNCVPKKLWAEYEEFSIGKKREMREELSKRHTAIKLDPFGRPV